MKTIYLGIDVSKDKLDVALTSDGNKFSQRPLFKILYWFSKLNVWVLKTLKSFYNVHFCIECNWHLSRRTI